MIFYKIFIITQAIFLAFQFFYYLKLESFQYYELVFGSFFLILFFGLFASLLLDNPDQNILPNSALLGILYSIWFYITKKLTNLINSDKNGVINF